MRNFLWCYYGWLITSWAFEKYIYIKNAIFFNLFWYKVFVHWKLKLLNFLVDSVLIYFSPKRFVLAIDVPYLGACLKYIWKWGDMLVALTFYHSKKWIFLQESLIIYIYTCIRILVFQPRLNIRIFLSILGWEYHWNILELFLIINDSLLHFSLLHSRDDSKNGCVAD